MSNLQTGYWGGFDPNGRMRVSRTHLQKTPSGKAVCGTRFASYMRFQICATRAYPPYVECRNCLEASGPARDKIRIEATLK